MTSTEQISKITYESTASYLSTVVGLQYKAWSELSGIEHKEVEKEVLFLLDHPQASAEDLYARTPKGTFTTYQQSPYAVKLYYEFHVAVVRALAPGRSIGHFVRVG